LGKISSKGQVTVPRTALEKLHLKPGDILEFTVQGHVLMAKPKKLIDAEQAWFWTEEWQKGEREADADIKSGRVTEYRSLRDFLKRREKKNR